jgi:transcriptional regulator with XRE-family HTH domain
MKIGQKIRQLRESQGIQQKTLAQSLGIRQATLSEWESGKNEPNPRHRKKIANHFKISEAELFGDIRPIEIKNVRIPIVSKAKGDDEDGFEFEPLEPHEYQYIDFTGCKGAQVTTNSMMPVARKGQQIMYKEEAEVIDGDLVFIGLKTGEQYFKRITRDQKKKLIVLETLNVATYRTRIIRENQVKFIYKVVGVKF